jgi:WD40 repeat protein
MRKNILCLIVAFLAAVACFVLLPVIGLLLLRIFAPGAFEGDALSWVLLIAGPALWTLLLFITIFVASVAFFVSEANLPDKGWLSAQTFVILSTFLATIAAAVVLAWPYVVEPPEAGPQQTGLSSLRLARTLKAAGNRFGTRQLAWSSDGERIASYGENGIASWSPDGKYQSVFRMFHNVLIPNVLNYLSGHRLLITTPFAEVDSNDVSIKLEDIAFSVVDAETGKVLQNVPGPHPGGGGPNNGAQYLAVSPDERFVAVICCAAKPQINIYSTKDWKQIATLDLRTGERGDTLDPDGLAFSSDGKALAVIHGLNGRIKFFNAESWAYSGSLVIFPEPSPPMSVISLSALAFSPDGTMIAVGSSSGGAWWTYPEGAIALPGSGAWKVGIPPDPLRVYRVSDGKLVASLGSFPGGLARHALVWSPNGEYLAFQDALGAIRFWNPFQPKLSVAVARKGFQAPDDILFSKDGSQLAAVFADGVKVFDVVPTR